MNDIGVLNDENVVLGYPEPVGSPMMPINLKFERPMTWAGILPIPKRGPAGGRARGAPFLGPITVQYL
jgi:hypothetical protein